MSSSIHISPPLRFKEFTDKYKDYKLSELMSRVSENNRDEEFKLDDILSLSTRHGIVDRKELLDDAYDKVNHKNYIKTRLNDFVFGKSISANYPYGIFKANKLRDGLLSTLYFTFKVSDKVLPSYLDCYFSHQNRANNFLKKYVLVGDRYITVDPDDLLRGEIYIPSKPEEQQKITSFFTVVDNKIKSLSNKKELLKEYKKGIAQKLFSQKVRFKNDKKNDFPDWDIKPLGKVAEKSNAKNTANEINEVYTNSATRGVVSQQDYFDKDIANKNNLDGYYIIKKDDFVYNPRISVSAPVGPINRNTLDTGVMSPLYTVFKFSGINLDYVEQYFQSSEWHAYMRSVANYGARHDRMNISNSAFFLMPIPLPHRDEQIKIANFLSAIDKKIRAVDKQLQEMEEWKKGLLQKMFC